MKTIQLALVNWILEGSPKCGLIEWTIELTYEKEKTGLYNIRGPLDLIKLGDKIV